MSNGESCKEDILRVAEKVEEEYGENAPIYHTRYGEIIAVMKPGEGMVILARITCADNKVVAVGEAYGVTSAFQLALGEKVGEFYKSLLALPAKLNISVAMTPSGSLTVETKFDLDSADLIDVVQAAFAFYALLAAWFLINLDRARSGLDLLEFSIKELEELAKEYLGGKDVSSINMLW